jgi:hypothetical protein
MRIVFVFCTLYFFLSHDRQNHISLSVEGRIRLLADKILENLGEGWNPA